MMDRRNKHFYLEGLQREIKALDEQEKKLREKLEDVVSLKQSKKKEMERLSDDSFMSETLARVYEQRRSTDPKRK